jgi:hypothetical protein
MIVGLWMGRKRVERERAKVIAAAVSRAMSNSLGGGDE